jgi:hypothetical protein
MRAMNFAPSPKDEKSSTADVAAASQMRSILEELDGEIDRQTYQENSRMDHDAPDDYEYCVMLTAKQVRAIGNAIRAATSDWRNQLGKWPQSPTGDDDK